MMRQLFRVPRGFQACLVVAWDEAADAVIGVRVGRVEVEDHDQVTALRHDQLVALVLARYVPTHICKLSDSAPHVREC